MTNNQITGTTDRVSITYYTDPLCCWSWALEPQWRKLRYVFQNAISWRYCMGGLLPGWNQFSDGVNTVNRPAQMGPIWMEAAHISGMPIHNQVWIKNPPASSYLACIAVKCAELQSTTLGEWYLRLLREAVMLRGENIAVQSTLLKIAGSLASTESSGFDLNRFQQDLENDRGLEAFRKDLNEVQSRGINRFPTLVFSSTHHASLLVTGYRPYTALVDVLRQMIPEIETQQQPITQEGFIEYWGSLTQRELDEATNQNGVLKKLEA